MSSSLSARGDTCNGVVSGDGEASATVLFWVDWGSAAQRGVLCDDEKLNRERMEPIFGRTVRGVIK